MGTPAGGPSSRPGRSRRLLWTAGATGGAGFGVVRLLAGQARRAEERSRPFATPAPVPTTSYGDPADPPLTLLLLGDSSAQGVGVAEFDASAGGLIAAALAAESRRVRVVVAAVTGARAESLAGQVAEVLATAPDGPRLALISTGANDVRARTVPRRAAADLGRAVAALRGAGIGVVAGTTPDLGVLRQLDQPMRGLAGQLSRRLEAAQVRAVLAAGGRPVRFCQDVAPAFRAEPGHFAPDGFHPSASGYLVMAEALLPALRSCM